MKGWAEVPLECRGSYLSSCMSNSMNSYMTECKNCFLYVIFQLLFFSTLPSKLFRMENPATVPQSCHLWCLCCFGEYMRVAK